MKNDQACQGPGIRVRQQQIAPGFIQQIQVRDDACVARGKAWKPKCDACPTGQTQSEETKLTVDVAPGMKDGETIVFSEVSHSLSLAVGVVSLCLQVKLISIYILIIGG